MSTSDTLSAQLEDYLEAILVISRENGAARVKEISGALGVHKSTVTAALHSLSDRGLVNYIPYHAATLTSEGRRVAAEVTKRHLAIKRFLVDVLLVEEAEAEENACRIEHTMDSDVLSRLVRFMDFAAVSEESDGPALAARFREYLGS